MSLCANKSLELLTTIGYTKLDSTLVDSLGERARFRRPGESPAFLFLEPPEKEKPQL